MRDLYQILGVTRTASEAEIKSAYRKLAKKLHPDVNPGRKDIEQKFKEITAAYDLLSDKDKRARFDRGEIDGMGNDKPFSRGGGDPFGSAYGGFNRGPRAQSYNYSSSPRGGESSFGFNPEDIFAEFFGGKNKRGGSGFSGGARAEAPQRGTDVNYTLNVPFVEACLGGKQRLTLPNRKTIDVNIPKGTNDGHKLRLRGQGEPGMEPGDAIIEVRVLPHPYFKREVDDILIELPISLLEAVAGAQVKVPTLDGHVTVKVPRYANAGTSLRLKGKGVPKVQGDAGDMFVKIKIMLPETPNDDLNNLIEKWGKKNAYDPRRKLGWS